jgi:hypothetical protein
MAETSKEEEEEEEDRLYVRSQTQRGERGLPRAIGTYFCYHLIRAWGLQGGGGGGGGAPVGIT